MSFQLTSFVSSDVKGEYRLDEPLPTFIFVPTSSSVKFEHIKKGSENKSLSDISGLISSSLLISHMSLGLITGLMVVCIK